jgi:hypothetical protein
MLVPVIIGLGVLSIFKGKTKEGRTRGVMTPDRTDLFQSALSSAVLTPANYERLATAFEQQGLPSEAMLLRKRARLRGMSPEEKETRKSIFRKALACQDPDAVERVAAVYEAQGATGSAKRLRECAIGLRTARGIRPVAPAPAPAPVPVPVEVLAADDTDGSQATDAGPASSDETADGISESQEKN